jgi:hypothetical protein
MLNLVTVRLTWRRFRFQAVVRISLPKIPFRPAADSPDGNQIEQGEKQRCQGQPDTGGPE